MSPTHTKRPRARRRKKILPALARCAAFFLVTLTLTLALGGGAVWLARGGLTPQILLEISDDSLIVEAAKQNWCAGITADFFARQYADDQVAIIPFRDDSFTRNVFLVRRKNQEMSSAEKRFWAFTPDWIGKNMEDGGAQAAR